MGIEDLLGMDAQTLAHEVNAIDEAALLFRIFRSFGAASVETGASDPGRPLGAAGSVPGTHPGTDEVSDHISDPREPPLGPAGTPREVGRYVRRAQAGDRSSARRVAELLELAGHDAVAAVWWGRAAQLGDPDAIAYVREFLGGASPTEILPAGASAPSKEGSVTGPSLQELSQPAELSQLLDSNGFGAAAPSHGITVVEVTPAPEEGKESPSMTSCHEKGRR